MTKKKKRLLILEVISCTLCFSVLIPVYILVINSFKDAAGAADMRLCLPEKWNIASNYSKVFEEAKLITAFFNSTVISLVAVTITVVLAGLTGFVFQRRKQKIVTLLNQIIMFGLIVPPSMVNTFLLAKKLHLTTGLIGAILVLITVNYPIAVFLYVGYYKSISRQIDESAIIDGCGPYRLFFNVIFPLLKPVTITVIVITFMAVWNDFNASIFFLNNPKKYTMVMTAYFFFGQKASDWNLVFADIILTSLPVIILYFTLQKYIVSGMTAGSIKG